MIKIKQILKPTLGKLLLTILFIPILPNFAYWSCCLEPPCQAEYRIQFGFQAFLFQTGMMIPKCGEFTYFYFWPLSIVIGYLISCFVMSFFIKIQKV